MMEGGRQGESEMRGRVKTKKKETEKYEKRKTNKKEKMK